MDYHWDSTTENSVCPKLGTMTHAVMTTISSNDNTSLEGLQFGKHLALVFLPIEINQWKKLGLKKKKKEQYNQQRIDYTGSRKVCVCL